jgi:peptide/nickel transport system ATP-binding protein
VVRHVCSAIAVMHDGEIVEHGTADQILTRPQHAYTRTLLAAVPSL